MAGQESEASAKSWFGEHVVALGGFLLVLLAATLILLSRPTEGLVFAAFGALLIFTGSERGRLLLADIPLIGKFWFKESQSARVASQPGDVVADAAALASHTRLLLASTVLESLTENTATCVIDVYMYDSKLDALAPISLHEQAAPVVGELPGAHHWKVGAGATGQAFQTGRMVYATDEAVWDTTYGVSQDQAHAFRDLTAVASLPVKNAAENVVAVITASTEASDLGELATAEEAYKLLIKRSPMIARVLIDLLRWAKDD